MRYKASYGGHELCGIFTYYNHLRDLPPPTYTYYLPIFRRGRLRYLSEHTGACFKGDKVLSSGLLV